MTLIEDRPTVSSHAHAAKRTPWEEPLLNG